MLNLFRIHGENIGGYTQSPVVFSISDTEKLPLDLETIHWKIFNDHAYIELSGDTADRFRHLFPNHPEIPKSKVGYYKLFGNAAYMVMLNWELEP